MFVCIGEVYDSGEKLHTALSLSSSVTGNIEMFLIVVCSLQSYSGRGHRVFLLGALMRVLPHGWREELLHREVSWGGNVVHGLGNLGEDSSHFGHVIPQCSASAFVTFRYLELYIGVGIGSVVTFWNCTRISALHIIMSLNFRISIRNYLYRFVFFNFHVMFCNSVLIYFSSR